MLDIGTINSYMMQVPVHASGAILGFVPWEAILAKAPPHESDAI